MLAKKVARLSPLFLNNPLRNGADKQLATHIDHGLGLLLGENMKTRRLLVVIMMHLVRLVFVYEVRQDPLRAS